MYLLLSLNFLELLKTILTFQLLLVFKPWSKQISHYTGSTSMQLRTVWLCPQEIASLKKAWMNYVWRRFYQQQRCKKKPLWTLYTLYRELYLDTFLPIPFFSNCLWRSHLRLKLERVMLQWIGVEKQMREKALKRITTPIRNFLKGKQKPTFLLSGWGLQEWTT